MPTPAFSRVYDCVTKEVLFKNATSVNCGKISAFAWDFGDGSTSTAQNPNAQVCNYRYVYSEILKYSYLEDLETLFPETLPSLKKGISGFTADDECFGDSVRFINSSTNAASYDWDFGDKTSSTV